MMQKELVDTWIRLQKADLDSTEYKRGEWSAVKLNMMCVTEPGTAWEVVIKIFESTSDAWIYENLGAGPLETLLGMHSDFALNAMKSYAELNPEFLEVAAYVWPHSLAPEVAQKFLAIADQSESSSGRRPKMK